MDHSSNGQISLTDFQQPMGMHLLEDNRWVKKAQIIPWAKIEEKYAEFFPFSTGNVAKSLRLALSACIIQQVYGCSDEEVTLQIRENPYLQDFCGHAGVDDRKPPFDPSSMVDFRKRLSGPALGRPKKGEQPDKAQDSLDECQRVEAERRFSLAKRKCGLGLVMAKLKDAAAHVVAMSILLLNLKKIQRAFTALLDWLFDSLGSAPKWEVIQWTFNQGALGLSR